MKPDMSGIQKKKELKKVIIESKFKIGDWICNGGGNPCKVNDIFGNYYELCSIEDYKYNKPISDVDANYHLWTIQDAKDGDVLSLDNKIFIYAHRRGMYPIAVAHCVVDNVIGFYLGGEFRYAEKGISISPATKEQRDLLFSKMKERGYEWDDEKKRIK